MASEKEKNGKKYYRELEDLPGIGEVTAERLKSKGYGTFNSIAASSPHELAEAGEFGVESAKKAIEASKEAIDVGYETGDQLFERRKSVYRITTGSQALDELIGGGAESGAITEFYGRFSSGKSQVAFQLAVNAQKGNGNGAAPVKVLFIDTEHTFRPERIFQMAKGAGLDPEEVLKNIFIAQAEDSEHQIILAEKAGELIAANNIKLVIVDSLTSHFRADYIGRGALSDRQQKLNKHIHVLQKLADKFNLVVYVTNQVMDMPDMMFGDPTKPIGGNVLAHAATYRVYVRKSKEEKRIARLVDSPNLPEGETIFKVTPEGVSD